MQKFFNIIILLLLLNATFYPQVVYESFSNDIYLFLQRISQRGIIKFNAQIKPLSRLYLAKKLQELTNEEENLTNLEKKELKFFLTDFGYEISILTNKSNSLKFLSFGKDKYRRIRLFSYAGSDFYINLDPVLGYRFGNNNNGSWRHIFNGVTIRGYLANQIGFSFNFQDNIESGLGVDSLKIFTPVTGINPKPKVPFEYNEVNVNLSYNWSWGTVSIGKNYFQWGYGKTGNIVLSTKAPSFPYFRLDLYPVDWLSFNYIHGWLNSKIIDSSLSYRTLRASPEFDRLIYRTKYFASHTVMLTPVRGFDFSIGESIIYSDRLKVLYFIPIMFFRLADHYLSNMNNNAGDNAQIFFGFSSKNHIKNTHIYGSVFVDEIRTTEIFNPLTNKNQFGFTLGFSITDLPVNNLTLNSEYTRINPFVYRHFIPTLTYQNQGYLMGHWVGDNADLMYFSLEYRFIRGLKSKVWYEYIRKGGEGTSDQMYQIPQPPFLFGLRTYYTYLGLDIKYEIIHDLFARAKFQYTKIEKQQDDLSFQTDSFNEFSIAIYYGL